MKLNRLDILKIAGVVIILSSILLMYTSFSQPAYRENVVKKGYYSISSKFNFSAELTPNMVYGKQKIAYGEGIFFQKLVDSIDIDYTINANTDPEGKISGDYKINAFLVSGKTTSPYWEKEIPLNISGEISSDVKEKIKLNLDEIYNLFQELESEVGVKGGRQILLIAEIKLNGVAGGKEFSRSIVHKTTITLDRMISVQNPELKEEKIISENQLLENKMSVFGIQSSVKKVRYISSVMLMIGIVSAGIPVGREYLTKRGRSDFGKKRGLWIVRASGAGFEMPANHIDVSSMEELIKLSYEFDRPIIDTGKEYFVIDGSVVFRFGKSR